MDLMSDDEQEWLDDAVCAQDSNKSKINFFFSDNEDEVEQAKTLCMSCPVRKKCLSKALNNREIWGVWGGASQDEIRDVLCLTEDEREVRRTKKGEAPYCLYCNANTEFLRTGQIDIPGGGRWTVRRTVTCSRCAFTWISRTSANSVDGYRSQYGLS